MCRIALRKSDVIELSQNQAKTGKVNANLAKYMVSERLSGTSDDDGRIHHL